MSIFCTRGFPASSNKALVSSAAALCNECFGALAKWLIG